VLAVRGSKSCGKCGSAINDYVECARAAREGVSVLGINNLGPAEDWSGPPGCHIQEGGNFQFNNNMMGESRSDHPLVCRKSSEDGDQEDEETWSMAECTSKMPTIMQTCPKVVAFQGSQTPETQAGATTEFCVLDGPCRKLADDLERNCATVPALAPIMAGLPFLKGLCSTATQKPEEKDDATTVVGSLTVAVSDPSVILNDAAAKTAFEKAMAAELADAAGNGVTATDVRVTVSAAGSSRRLDGGGLSVSYTIMMTNAVADPGQVVTQMAGQTNSQLQTRVEAAVRRAQASVPALSSLSVTGASHATTPVASTAEKGPAPAPAPTPVYTPSTDSKTVPTPVPTPSPVTSSNTQDVADGSVSLALVGRATLAFAVLMLLVS
jgi:hypothetical protein